jgi:hypothetical protein
MESIMALSQNELNSIFEYEPLTGVVRWKERRSNIAQGSIAGCVHGSGYKVVTINSKTYKLHRIIWIMLFGQIPENFYLDHINGNKIDNRLENLRLATNNQNQQNRPAPKNSSSGYRGVTWHKQVNKWMARICHEGKRTTIGFFDTAEDAYEAYKQEAKKLFTHIDRLPTRT